MYNYSEFITEKRLEALLESKLVLSNGFLNVLKSIQSPVSSYLISLGSKDVNLQQNFIDLGTDNDSVMFTTDRKAQEIIGGKEILYKVSQGGRTLRNTDSNINTFNKLGFQRPEGDIYKPTVGTIGKILSEIVGTNSKIYCHFECTQSPNSSDIGMKTVINKEALSDHDDTLSKVWTTSRNPIRIGRLVRALYRSGSTTISDSEIEKFVNDYKATIDIINDAFSRFEVVQGSTISKLYNHDYYESDDGTLGSSCMADMPDSTFDMYVDNPEVCKLVVLWSKNGSIVGGKYNSDKICGRAILWTTRSGDILMDRIYTNNDSDVDLFKKFANKNNWWCKRNQSSSSNFTAERGNESKITDYIVDLKHWEEPYPYLDTLCYLNSGTGELSNSKEDVSADRLLNDTGGGYDYLDDDDE